MGAACGRQRRSTSGGSLIAPSDARSHELDSSAYKPAPKLVKGAVEPTPPALVRSFSRKRTQLACCVCIVLVVFSLALLIYYRYFDLGPVYLPDPSAKGWPGGVYCEHGMRDVFQITPKYCNESSHPENNPPGCTKDMLSMPEHADEPNYNSCTMICLPPAFKVIGSAHHMQFGLTCFDHNTIETDKYGTGIVCPGAEYLHTYHFMGIVMFTFYCAGGEVIDYGMPYK